MHQPIQVKQPELLALFVMLLACNLKICVWVGETKNEEEREESEPSRTVASPRSVEV